MNQSTSVGIGVVGAGSVGIRGALMHLSLPDVQDRVTLSAVCDPVPGRAQAAAKTYNVLSAYSSYEELLEDPNVDAVTICSPIGLHYRQGLMAIEAGKHVHFNKTMTTHVYEANELISLAQKNNVRIVASPGVMSFPHNQRIRKLILEGELGKLNWAIAQAGGEGVGKNYHLNESLRSRNDILGNIDPSWYFQKPSGGPQYDVTVYPLHILTGIVGPAKRVTAMSGIFLQERYFRDKKIVCDMDDTTILLLDFGDAFFALVSATVCGRIVATDQPNIYGGEGTIIGTMFGEKNLSLPDDNMPHWYGQHLQLEEPHVFEDIMQLVDWIREGKPSISSVEHARHVIEIIEAGYRAAETGQTQEIVTTFEPMQKRSLC